MAKITRITYTLLANLGNYENEKLELEAILDEDDNYLEVIGDLKTKVHSNVNSQIKYESLQKEFDELQKDIKFLQIGKQKITNKMGNSDLL